MKGIAEGAGVKYEDILALNVRTEIAFGSFVSDGCTALSWLDKTKGEGKGQKSYLGQNWDWDVRYEPFLLPRVVFLFSLLRITLLFKDSLRLRAPSQQRFPPRSRLRMRMLIR
jgi:hypothetical protein